MAEKKKVSLELFMNNPDSNVFLIFKVDEQLVGKLNGHLEFIKKCLAGYSSDVICGHFNCSWDKYDKAVRALIKVLTTECIYNIDDIVADCFGKSNTESMERISEYANDIECVVSVCANGADPSHTTETMLEIVSDLGLVSKDTYPMLVTFLYGLGAVSRPVGKVYAYGKKINEEGE